MIAVDLSLGDFHIGHKTGLCYPKDLGDYKPNFYQKWLFKQYNIYLDRVGEYLNWVEKHYGAIDHVNVNFGGDMGDLDQKKRSSHEYWAFTEDMVSENAGMLLDPLYKLCDTAHWIRGTRSHVGIMGGMDDVLAKDCEITEVIDGKHSHYDLDYRLAGVVVNDRHVGKNTSKWSDINLIAALGSEMVLERHKHGLIVPDICYRHHYHWGGSTEKRKRPVMVASTAWQLPYEYIYEIDAKGKIQEVGGYVMVFIDGEIMPLHDIFIPFTIGKGKPHDVRKPQP